jgi:hypothetical protein
VSLPTFAPARWRHTGDRPWPTPGHQEPATDCLAASTPDATSYASVPDLVQALIRAATAHGEHEKRNGGEYDEQGPVWCAACMVAEQSGAESRVAA